MSEIDPSQRATLRRLQDEKRAADEAARSGDVASQQAMQAEILQKREHLARVIPFAARVAAVATGTVPPNVTLGIDGGTKYRRKWSGQIKSSERIFHPMIEGWKIARHKSYFSNYHDGDSWNPPGTAGGTRWHTVTLTVDGELVTHTTCLLSGASLTGMERFTTPTNPYASPRRDSHGRIARPSYTLRDLSNLSEPTTETYSPGTTSTHILTDPNVYPLPHPGDGVEPLFAEPEVIEQGLVEFVVHHGLKV